MKTEPLDTVCIVGAGFMGAQIGLQCAARGCTVWLVDTQEDSLQRATGRHSQELDSWLEKGHITPDERQAILGRIHTSTKLQAGVSSAALVIESVPEQVAIKRAVFAEADGLCPQHTILATNSSCLRVSAIESATDRPDRVLNMHFYPPVWQRTLVELMPGTATSDQTIERAVQFAHADTTCVGTSSTVRRGTCRSRS